MISAGGGLMLAVSFFLGAQWFLVGFEKLCVRAVSGQTQSRRAWYGHKYTGYMLFWRWWESVLYENLQ